MVGCKAKIALTSGSHGNQSCAMSAVSHDTKIMAALRRIGVPILRGLLCPGTSVDTGIAVTQLRRSSDEPYAQERPPVAGRLIFTT